MQIIILTATKIYNPDNNSIVIGGTETYVYELAKTCAKEGYETVILQKGDRLFDTNSDGVKIKGINVPTNKQLFNIAYKEYGFKAVYIVSNDAMDIKVDLPNVIAIQHGIGFDYPCTKYKIQIFNYLYKLLKNIAHLYRFHNVKNIVCVDYNYFNWLRAIHQIPDDRTVRVIPNFSHSLISKDELNSKLATYSGVKSIIFARRFVDYRGTRLFANVALRLINKYPYLKITFAGEGPDNEYLKDVFKNISNVNITSFQYKDSIKVSYNYDISVVPTIFSEGTSLSLCEAMASGCYPVVTHVGGMTNIIVDKFNGSLSYISEDDFYDTLEKVILMDREDFISVVNNAYNTIYYSLSIDVWRKRWIDYINLVVKNIK